jgi:hypothetical protein
MRPPARAVSGDLRCGRTCEATSLQKPGKGRLKFFHRLGAWDAVTTVDSPKALEAVERGRIGEADGVKCVDDCGELLVRAPEQYREQSGQLLPVKG